MGMALTLLEWVLKLTMSIEVGLAMGMALTLLEWVLKLAVSIEILAKCSYSAGTVHGHSLRIEHLEQGHICIDNRTQLGLAMGMAPTLLEWVLKLAVSIEILAKCCRRLGYYIGRSLWLQIMGFAKIYCA